MSRLGALAVPADLDELVAAQHCVVTRAQLTRYGYGPASVRAAINARRWQAFGRRVVVLHNADLSPAQRPWVAVLMLDQPAALCGLTAAEHAGLSGFETPLVHLVVSRACDAELPGWARVHNSRRFEPADIHPGAMLARTRIERSLIDAAAWSTAPRRACAILCSGVQQRLVRADGLRDELARVGMVRHRRIMCAVLGDIAGGAHTLDEIDLAPLGRRAGLPAPRRQALRRERSGRARYVDAEFDLPDGQTLLVEVDGAVHLKPLGWWDDMSRHNELAIDGNTLLRFDSVTMRLNPAVVVRQLARMRLAHQPVIDSQRRYASKR